MSTARFHTRDHEAPDGTAYTDVWDGGLMVGYTAYEGPMVGWRAQLSGHYEYLSGLVGTYDTRQAAVRAVKRQYLKKTGARA